MRQPILLGRHEASGCQPPTAGTPNFYQRTSCRSGLQTYLLLTALAGGDTAHDPAVTRDWDGKAPEARV
jgi:hypothetical protein